jgi:hypothetical protein
MKALGVLLVAAVVTFPLSCDDDDEGGDAAPPERQGVTLSLNRDTRELTIENATGKRLEYGVAYKLERRTPEGWRWVNRDSAFILILKVIEPGGREREMINLPGESGHYRISKSFTDPATDEEIPATVEFDVP